MLVSDLKKHPLFETCTLREQLFLTTYLKTNGDILKASRAAYPGQRGASQKALALQRRGKISALLVYIDGEETPTKDDVLKVLWQAMRAANNPYAVVKAAKLITDLEGYNKKPSEEEIRKLKIKMAKEIDNAK